jgi:D-3-phosphoglycerate dehydrogenase
MKVLICDYKEGLGENVEFSYNLLKRELSGISEIIVEEMTGDETLKEMTGDTDFLLTAYTPVNKGILLSAPQLKLISVAATGYNYIDIQAATERGVAVCHVNEYCTGEVADHAMTLLLNLNKKIKVHQKNIENNGHWDYLAAKGSLRLADSVLGILGFGRIGRAIAQRAQAFGLTVIAYDPYVRDDEFKKSRVERVSPDEIYSRSDFISVNMLLTAENQGFINEEAFKKMTHHPYIINVARGGLICEEDMVHALNRGDIAGAGLDVLSTENPDLTENPLVGLDNVIITPHSAFYSETSLRQVQETAAMNIVNYIKGRKELIQRVINPEVWGKKEN